MMRALTYELLMRAAFDVGRGGAANADIYRAWDLAIRAVQLQRNAIDKKERTIDSRSVDELDYEAIRSAAVVKGNVASAISKVRTRPWPADIERKLMQLQTELQNVSLNDRESLDRMIDATWKMFNELKLPQS